VRDLEAQLATVKSLCVVAPLGTSPAPNSQAIPAEVRVVTYDKVASADQADALVRDYDIVQVNAGQPRWRSAIYFRLAQAAHRNGRRVITAVTSNRAKTRVLNSVSLSLPGRVKAKVIAASIRRVVRSLARNSDGVLLVGDGLRELLPRDPPQTYVETASWIRADEVIDDSQLEQRVRDLQQRQTLRICVATNLQPMKGVHVAVEAMKLLRDRLGAAAAARSISLTILGEGPELSSLKEAVRAFDLENIVSFGGTFDYPQPFLREIGRYHLMLLTNLNDEQPRLIFDAASQGLLLLCPDSPPYRALGLDGRILYKRGDAAALSLAIERVNQREDLEGLLREIHRFATRFTVDTMHARRARWISETLLRDSVVA
jgi:glycosyltransferase involved in cell wall biosynthesis